MPVRLDYPIFLLILPLAIVAAGAHAPAGLVAVGLATRSVGCAAFRRRDGLCAGAGPAERARGRRRGLGRHRRGRVGEHVAGCRASRPDFRRTDPAHPQGRRPGRPGGVRGRRAHRPAVDGNGRSATSARSCHARPGRDRSGRGVARLGRPGARRQQPAHHLAVRRCGDLGRPGRGARPGWRRTGRRRFAGPPAGLSGSADRDGPGATVRARRRDVRRHGGDRLDGDRYRAPASLDRQPAGQRAGHPAQSRPEPRHDLAHCQRRRASIRSACA